MSKIDLIPVTSLVGSGVSEVDQGGSQLSRESGCFISRFNN